MAVDPMIARGSPGIDVTNTLAQIAQMRQRDQMLQQQGQQNALMQQRYQAGVEQQDELDEREAQWADLVRAGRIDEAATLAPDLTQEWVTIQKQLAELEKAKNPQPQPSVAFQDGPFGAKVAMGSDGRWQIIEPPRPQQQAQGAWSAPFQAVGPDGKPGLYRQHSITGDVQPVNVGGGNLAPPPKQGAAGPNPLGNERQVAGVKIQQENALSYAANLTGISRDEMDRIYATEGADGVAKAMLEKGKRPLQGAAARVLQSFPLGKTLVEAKNADLIAPAKGGGAGIALFQNPTGPITVSDFQAGEAQFPNATYPLQSQAEMVRQMLKNGEKAQPAASTPDNDPLGLR